MLLTILVESDMDLGFFLRDSISILSARNQQEPYV
jgi:hypothetical protein